MDGVLLLGAVWPNVDIVNVEAGLHRLQNRAVERLAIRMYSIRYMSFLHNRDIDDSESKVFCSLLCFYHEASLV
jgi:hypothetical protein